MRLEIACLRMFTSGEDGVLQGENLSRSLRSVRIFELSVACSPPLPTSSLQKRSGDGDSQNLVRRIRSGL
jgi:hypothetical protein